jgi:hypothetical protein
MTDPFRPFRAAFDDLIAGFAQQDEAQVRRATAAVLAQFHPHMPLPEAFAADEQPVDDLLAHYVRTGKQLKVDGSSLHQVLKTLLEGGLTLRASASVAVFLAPWPGHDAENGQLTALLLGEGSAVSWTHLQDERLVGTALAHGKGYLAAALLDAGAPLPARIEGPYDPYVVAFDSTLPTHLMKAGVPLTPWTVGMVLNAEAFEAERTHPPFHHYYWETDVWARLEDWVKTGQLDPRVLISPKGHTLFHGLLESELAVNDISRLGAVLRKYGADPAKSTKSGYTPLHSLIDVAQPFLDEATMDARLKVVTEEWGLSHRALRKGKTPLEWFMATAADPQLEDYCSQTDDDQFVASVAAREVWVPQALAALEIKALALEQAARIQKQAPERKGNLRPGRRS